MKAAFADTFYFLALLNNRDPAHERAVVLSKAPDQTFVTTEFVLLELADALSRPPLREEFKAICALVHSTASFTLVPASSELLSRGQALYHDRPEPREPLTGSQHEAVSTALNRVNEALAQSPERTAKTR